MDLSRPVFLGFRVKRVVEGPPGSGVAEVCSVSDCLAPAPPGWVERWDFDRAGCYDDEVTALATIPPGEEGRYDLFAYRLLPVRFVGGGAESILGRMPFPEDLPELPAEPDLNSFVPIGYDLVSRCGPEPYLGFDCSPLTCNGLSGEHGANRFGLIDDLNHAVAVGRIFGAAQPEPGPYYLIEVLRKRSERWDGRGAGAPTAP